MTTHPIAPDPGYLEQLADDAEYERRRAERHTTPAAPAAGPSAPSSAQRPSEGAPSSVAPIGRHLNAVPGGAGGDPPESDGPGAGTARAV